MAWQPNRRGYVRPPKTLRRQQWELVLLYLGSLSGVLLVFAVVVRGVVRTSEMADTRGQLSVIAEDLANLPMPEPGNEKALQETRRDFATAHQQLEWFVGSEREPLARLGEIRILGPLPRRVPGKTLYWQEGDDWLALVRPLDTSGAAGRGTVWLRVSQGLEPSEQRLHQLDLALLIAIAAALSLSALSAWLLTRRAVRPLERSLSRLRQFSLDASHELRGPLAALAANAEMGLLDLDRATDGPGVLAQRRRFEAIASATDQMEQLVDDLLLLARQDEQRLEAPRPVVLSSLLAQQLDLLRDAFALKDLQLNSQISAGLTVLGQAPLLQRLFRNLLDNALAYTPAGGEVRVEAYAKGSEVVVAVHDTGIGLAPEELPQVFDRFWRASSDRRERGSGLGLAIASRICHSHGGTIRATSALDQGSCFVVELPAMATGWSASAW